MQHTTARTLPEPLSPPRRPRRPPHRRPHSPFRSLQSSVPAPPPAPSGPDPALHPRPSVHPQPLGPRRRRPGAPRGPRRGRLRPVPASAPGAGTRRLRPPLLPCLRGTLLGRGGRALPVPRVRRRLLAARRGARPPAAQPPAAGARGGSRGARARRPGLGGGAAAAVPCRRRPAVRRLPHGHGTRAARVGAALEEGAARQGAPERAPRVPIPPQSGSRCRVVPFLFIWVPVLDGILYSLPILICGSPRPFLDSWSSE